MLLISDANILIDMESAGLLEVLFRLPEDLAVPDILFAEELAERHGRLPALGLRVLELEPGAVDLALELRGRYHKPSQNDLFALALAATLPCPLLTGDRHLREAADCEEVTVRGTGRSG